MQDNYKNNIQKKIFRLFVFQSSLKQYLSSILVIAVITIICYVIHTSIGYQTVSFFFLLTISLLPLFNFGPGPIFLAATLSAFSWNYFFIPPQFTLDIYKIEDFLMLIMYFIVAMVTGVLSARIRKQEKFVRLREERTNALYKFSKELSAAYNLDNVVEIAVSNIGNTFNLDIALILSGPNGELSPKEHIKSSFTITDSDWQISNWVFETRQPAGKFTKTLPSSEITQIPLFSVNKSLGVLGLKYKNNLPLSQGQETLLNAFITQLSTAIEKEKLNEEAKKSLIISESEKLYKSLFDSVSHELKTPLTAIIGATSSLKDKKIKQNASLLSGLINEITIAAERLNRLVENLLDMTRLESGNLKPKLEWHSVSDLISSAIGRLSNESSQYEIFFVEKVEGEFLQFDFALLEQAIVNILLNSINYTPPGSKIVVAVNKSDKDIVINISDNGKGFPEEAIPNLFKKFYRAPGTRSGGTGLGLSIARGFIEAHKGTIFAQNKREGGAEFIIFLPIN
jgi:two-component system sensor histidine kinase KdpD